MVAQPTVSKCTRAETAFAHSHEDRWPSHSPQHSLTRQSTASSAAARKHERAPRAGSVRGPAAASNVLCGPVQTSAFGSRADGIAGRSDGEVYSTGRSTALQEVPGTCLDVGTQPPATDDGPKARHTRQCGAARAAPHAATCGRGSIAAAGSGAWRPARARSEGQLLASEANERWGKAHGSAACRAPCAPERATPAPRGAAELWCNTVWRRAWPRGAQRGVRKRGARQG